MGLFYRRLSVSSPPLGWGGQPGGGEVSGKGGRGRKRKRARSTYRGRRRLLGKETEEAAGQAVSFGFYFPQAVKTL